jgi:cyclopropane fatty-acyl-phospholipid synthase-like methyltransferase
VEVPVTRPSWWWDETRGLAVDFADPDEVAGYDVRQGTDPEVERRRIERLGITAGDLVIEFGCGTGALAVAAAEAGAGVHAVDVSPTMLAATRERARQAGVEVATHQAGFLTYEHAGPAADWIVSRYALHHLPDPWKVTALTRMRGQLASDGRVLIDDVTYSFPPERFEDEIERWITRATARDGSFSRDAFEAHVRDEHSTYTWAFEAMLERCGFVIVERELPSPTHASYLAAASP